MKVSDIMTKEVISIRPNDKIIDVAEILQQKGFNGIPVVENGKILGMITESDLISRGSTSLHIPSLIKVFHEFQLEKYISEKNKENFQPYFQCRCWFSDESGLYIC
jgi:signal-transduction protein with cAMP-binding, CBS, and nucleotidyltransferase domain